MNYKTVEGELGVAGFRVIIFSGVHFQTLVAVHPPRLYSNIPLRMVIAERLCSNLAFFTCSSAL